MAAPSAPPAPSTEHERAARRLARDEARALRLAPPGEPTPEQLRRNLYRSVQTKDPDSPHAIIVRRNITARAIDRWRARGMISERQHSAADRYRQDYDRGGWERPITGRYEGGGGSGSGTPNMTGLMAATHAQLDARKRFRDARKVLPKCLAARFDSMVLHEDEAQAVGEREGRVGAQAARFAIEWLKICCDELADYYRM